MTDGERIRQLLRENKLTIAALAKAGGVTWQAAQKVGDRARDGRECSPERVRGPPGARN